MLISEIDAKEPRLIFRGKKSDEPEKKNVLVLMYTRGTTMSGYCTAEKPPGAATSSASVEKSGAEEGMAMELGSPTMHGDDTLARTCEYEEAPPEALQVPLKSRSVTVENAGYTDEQNV